MGISRCLASSAVLSIACGGAEPQPVEPVALAVAPPAGSSATVDAPARPRVDPLDFFAAEVIDDDPCPWLDGAAVPRDVHRTYARQVTIINGKKTERASCTFTARNGAPLDDAGARAALAAFHPPPDRHVWLRGGVPFDDLVVTSDWIVDRTSVRGATRLPPQAEEGTDLFGQKVTSTFVEIVVDLEPAARDRLAAWFDAHGPRPNVRVGSGVRILPASLFMTKDAPPRFVVAFDTDPVHSTDAVAEALLARLSEK